MFHLLADFVPSPTARRPLTGESFLKELLPPIVLYYATAFLVVTRGTLKIRIALLPITIWTAFRAGSGLDVVAGVVDQRFVHLNQALTVRYLCDSVVLSNSETHVTACDDNTQYARHNMDFSVRALYST
jgi:hypothetical protein